MKVFAALLMLAAMIMSTIVGYHLVVTAIPSWLTFWAVSVTLTYAGFVASAIASAMED